LPADPDHDRLAVPGSELKGPKLASAPVVVVSDFENTLNVDAAIRKPFLLEDSSTPTDGLTACSLRLDLAEA
jgi:hypothetical protein